MTAASTARSSGSPIICRRRRASAAAAAVADRRQARRAGERRDRAAAGVRRQRPAGRDDGRRRCAPTSTASRVAPGRARRGLHQQRRRLANRARRCSRKRGVDIAAIVDSRPEVPRASDKRNARTRAIIADAQVSGDQGGHRCCARSTVATRERHGADRRRCAWRCRAAGIPSSALTCHLGGRPVWNEDLAAFVPGSRRPG